MPDALQSDIHTSRAIADFFVCGFFSPSIASLAAAVLAVVDATLWLPLALTVTAFFAAYGCYLMAVKSCLY